MSHSDKKPGILNNVISLLGAVLAVSAFSAILALIALDFISKNAHPYLGIVTYIFLPVFLAAGLFLIVLGAFLERKRRRRKDPENIKPFPVLDFNAPNHRRSFVAITAGVTLFAIFTIFGSFRAYHYTESVAFCGTTCHQVMEPEYTAYKHSPHARVACVECHVGSGAEWYLRSKLSGAYQVYSVIFNKYHRPIETPIKNLRPAQQTCEQCHWPQQFFGAVENDHRYFLSDEANTPWQTRMLVLVGGGERTADDRKGIHWHMNIDNTIEYVATDEKRQVIPWVKKISSSGEETIFVDKGSKYAPDRPPEGERRRMDCIDCHNRPSHNFKSPRDSVNSAMARGDIAVTLPFIKKQALRVLAAKYKTKEEALTAIDREIRKFYAEKYPDISKAQSHEIDRTVSALQEIYRINFFPVMGVSWEAYPENIGHMTAPGCFRCHDGKHESADGKVISNACASCHVIVSQGVPGAMESSLEGLPFKHPDPDSEGLWQDMSCSECHTGGPM